MGVKNARIIAKIKFPINMNRYGCTKENTLFKRA
jgi:hypothetical protein